MSTQASLSVVVEGPADARIIRAVLGKELSAALRFFATGGRASLATIGRNILVHEGDPVLLVMNSYTRNQHLVEELQSMAFVATSGMAPSGPARSGGWVKVFSFVPEIEVLFFEAPQSLELILGKKVPEEKIEEGLLAPEAVLLKVFGNGQINYETLATGMSPEVASLLAGGKQAQALRATIESMLSPAAAV
jgi:hypothetical protein